MRKKLTYVLAAVSLLGIGAVLGAYSNYPIWAVNGVYNDHRALVIGLRDGSQWGLVEQEPGQFIQIGKFIENHGAEDKELKKKVLEKRLISF